MSILLVAVVNSSPSLAEGTQGPPACSWAWIAGRSPSGPECSGSTAAGNLPADTGIGIILTGSDTSLCDAHSTQKAGPCFGVSKQGVLKRRLMAKRQIVVKDALKDIRSGMSDIWIMRKYRLDARGLQSLLKKLLERGDLKPEEVEERITGLTNAKVLTDAQVAELSEEMQRVKEHKPAAPGDRTVKAVELVRDIRAGVDDYDLMEKYSLSAKGLKNVLDKLVQAGSITRKELDQRMPSYDSTVDLRDVVYDMGLDEGPRVAPRTMWDSPHPAGSNRDRVRTALEPDFGVFQEEPKVQMSGTLMFPVPIFNTKTPKVMGRVQDVSETTIVAVGLVCKTGDSGVFLVKPEDFGPIESFRFAATCLWVKNDTGESVAALRITRMSEQDGAQLRKVIETLTL